MDPRIRVLLKLIHEHVGSADFDLARASKMLSLSEPYILRLFHREIGKTLGRCLREARMCRAARLLRQNSQPIKTIASECGYTDISNFYRDFKSVYGVTPRELRFRTWIVLTDSSSAVALAS